MNVYQGLKGYPIIGKYGKLSWIKKIQRFQELPVNTMNYRGNGLNIFQFHNQVVKFMDSLVQ